MLLNKAYYTFKFLLPRRLQIELRRYYVNWKRSLHTDIWPIDPNAAQPREYVGKTGATPYFLPEKIGSCTGFSGMGEYDAASRKRGTAPEFPSGKSGAVPPFRFSGPLEGMENNRELSPLFPIWPNGKKFALVLTHDVETAEGLDKCYQLAEIEERLGFRSSFSFVPGIILFPQHYG